MVADEDDRLPDLVGRGADHIGLVGRGLGVPVGDQLVVEDVVVCELVAGGRLSSHTMLRPRRRGHRGGC